MSRKVAVMAIVSAKPALAGETRDKEVVVRPTFSVWTGLMADW